MKKNLKAVSKHSLISLGLLYGGECLADWIRRNPKKLFEAREVIRDF